MNHNPYAKKVKLSPLVLAGFFAVFCAISACSALAFIAVLAL